MKNVKLHMLKNKVSTYFVKHRKKARIAKALIAILIYCIFKYHWKIDIDTLFIILSIAYISEIRH